MDSLTSGLPLMLARVISQARTSANSSSRLALSSAVGLLPGALFWRAVASSPTSCRNHMNVPGIPRRRSLAS